MITHIVVFKLPERNAEIAQTLRDKLMALPALIPQIKHYEVGINQIEADRNYDLVLISKFESMDDLTVYAKHPDHLVVVEYVRAVTSHVVAVDYES